MSPRKLRAVFLPLFGAMFACTKSSDSASNTLGAATQTATQSPTASAPTADTVGATLSTADIRKLEWIQGAWKGTGDVPTPFYEQYDLVNDSTLRVLTFTDSTLTVANDSTFQTLRGGRFGNHDKSSRYVAKKLDADHAEFIPVTARNRFIWRKKDQNSWEAVIVISATSTAAAKQLNYVMTRYSPAAIRR